MHFSNDGYAVNYHRSRHSISVEARRKPGLQFQESRQSDFIHGLFCANRHLKVVPYLSLIASDPTGYLLYSGDRTSLDLQEVGPRSAGKDEGLYAFFG